MMQRQGLANLIWVWVISFSLAGFPSENGKALKEIVQNQFSKDCSVKKETHFFKQEIAKKRFNIRFRVKCGNSEKLAYLENHIVRTMRQVLLITVDEKTNQSKLDEIKVLIFNEPIEYKAPKQWLAQFSNLQVQNYQPTKIDGISGATLTVNAVKNSVSNVQNLHSHIKTL